MRSVSIGAAVSKFITTVLVLEARVYVAAPGRRIPSPLSEALLEECSDAMSSSTIGGLGWVRVNGSSMHRSLEQEKNKNRHGSLKKEQKQEHV